MKPSPKVPTFKRGDEVTWTSQAGGYVKKKRGVIVEVVKPERRPTNVDGDYLRFRGGFGHELVASVRNHRSYIVKTADGKLYWPLVKYLRAVKSNGKGGK